jgi:hypothetical protein
LDAVRFRIFLLGEVLSGTQREIVRWASLRVGRRFRPTYTGANVGHPSKGERMVQNSG